MINIRILGNKYQIPSSLDDIKLTRWIEYVNFVKSNAPVESEAKEFSDLDDDERILHIEYYCKEISFWTGCPMDDLRRFPINEIYGIWAYIQHRIQPSEDLSFHKFSIGADTWHLPTRLMTDSTLEDYAEANNYEHAMNGLLNAEYESIFYVAAVICRKSKKERYDDYNDDDRIEYFRENLTASHAYQIGFFLLRLSEKSMTDLQIYTTAQALMKLKQVSKT